MKLTLKRVNRENLGDALAMRVAKEQSKFVAPTVVSMAQAAVIPEFLPHIAYDGDTPVGFVLWVLRDEDDGECWIPRLLVPAEQQGKGYGRAILREAIAAIRRDRPDAARVYLSFEPENTVAQRLYESLDFVPDGRVEDGETVYRLDF